MRPTMWLLLSVLFQLNSAFAYWTYETLNITNWQWQSSVVVGDWLYIDGGQLYANVKGVNTLFYLGQTISVDLSQSWSNATFPSRSIDTQRLNDGHWTWRPSLFYDPLKNQVYQWGGWPLQYGSPPMLWTFTPGNYGAVTWTEQTTPVTNEVDHTSPLLANAAWIASDKALYCLGGNLAEEYYNPYVAVRGLVEYNFHTTTWTNSSSDSATSSGFLVGGGAAYASQFGKEGYLIFIGGTAPETQIFDADGTQLLDMSVITLYDIDNGVWYHQTVTGTVPPPRQFFCIVGSSSKEGTFEIFIHGGSTNSTFDYSNADDDSYRNVYALSLPAFTWFRSTDNSQVRRAEHNCHVVGKRQMLVIGGSFPSNPLNTSADDPWPNGVGVFDMTAFEWSNLYNASADEYGQPESVKSYYNTGYKKPNWDDPALAEIFAYTPTSQSTPTPSSSLNSTPFTTTPTPTATTSPAANPPIKTSHLGAIVGGVVGGMAGLTLILVFVYVLMRRRRRSKLSTTNEIDPGLSLAEEKKTHKLESPTPTAELSGEEKRRHELESPSPELPGDSPTLGGFRGVKRKPLPAELP